MKKLMTVFLLVAAMALAQAADPAIQTEQSVTVVTAVSSNAPLAYQWYKTNTTVEGATYTYSVITTNATARATNTVRRANANNPAGIPTLIDPETLTNWSAPYRGWTYWPTHVLPARPPLPGVTNILGTDIPTVFQIPGDDKYYMSFVAFQGTGYQSYIAESTNLIDWGNYQLAMEFGPTNEYDHGGRVIGAFLYEDYDIKAPKVLKKRDGKYWSLYSYYGQQGGYEQHPDGHGLACSDDGIHWRRAIDQPVLTIHDPDCGQWESNRIYMPWLVEYKGRYFDFYNAAYKNHEQSGVAFSADLIHWIHYPANPIIPNRKGGYDEGFASDPKVYRDGDHWTMFYFGVGFHSAQIMIAFSRDLVNWTADPEPLYKGGGNPSGLDKQYAHKTSLIYNPKNDTFYLFYDAVPGEKGNIAGGRGIGLITSKPIN